MDWYFLLGIVVFFTIGIVMVFLAFQGPRCVDFDESHYEELTREEQLSNENLNLSMPLPRTDDENDTTPAVSLTSPYPQKPPPLGFGRILAERGQITNPYSQEDVCRKPYSVGFGSFPYVDPPSNFNTKYYEPSQPHVNEMTPYSRPTQSPSVLTKTSAVSYTRQEAPPPPYTEAVGKSQQSVRPRRNRFKKRLSQ